MMMIKAIKIRPYLKPTYTFRIGNKCILYNIACYKRNTYDFSYN